MRLFTVKFLCFGLRVTALALLMLAVSVAAFWPVGYRRGHVPFAFRIGIAVIKGSVSVIYNTEDLPGWPPGLLTFPLNPADPPPLAPHEWMGFGFGIAGGEGRACMPAPAAIIALLAGSASAWAVVPRLRREGYVAGRCATCGYDLRASPGRCLECGAIAQLRRPENSHPLV